MLAFNSKEERFYSVWNSEIAHEWLRSRARAPEVEMAPFHLALLYLVELHSSLQWLLAARRDEADQVRVLNRLADLHEGPVTAELPNLLERYSRELARVHPRPIRFCGERHSSYSHALASYRQRTTQLFGAIVQYPAHSEVDDLQEFLAERHATFEHFREDRRIQGDRSERFDFFVTANNGCFCGRDLRVYEAWLVQNRRWDFRQETPDRQETPIHTKLTLKGLCGRLGLSDTRLLDYRKRARLPVGRSGERPVFSPNDIVALCLAIERTCPTAETCLRASELKAMYLPNPQILEPGAS